MYFKILLFLAISLANQAFAETPLMPNFDPSFKASQEILRVFPDVQSLQDGSDTESQYGELPFTYCNLVQAIRISSPQKNKEIQYRVHEWTLNSLIVVEVLLSHAWNFPVQVRNQLISDLLEEAIRGDQISIVRFFLEKGLDVNQARIKGIYTPIGYASLRGQVGIVFYLLSAKADSKILDEEGKSAADRALEGYVEKYRSPSQARLMKWITEDYKVILKSNL
jgi:hypothetical protein